MKNIIIILLFSLNINAQTFYSQNVSTNAITHVKSLSVDASNNIWIGSEFGLVKFNRTTKTYFNTSNSGLPTNNINVVMAQSSVIWVGTNYGLSKYSGGTWTTYTTANGLVNNNVNCIYIDGSGYLWIGTNGGMSKYDGNISWTNYTSGSSGLVNNHVNAISHDANYTLYIATDYGITKFNVYSDVMTNWNLYFCSCFTMNPVKTICVAPANGSSLVDPFWAGFSAPVSLTYSGHLDPYTYIEWGYNGTFYGLTDYFSNISEWPSNQIYTRNNYVIFCFQGGGAYQIRTGTGGTGIGIQWLQCNSCYPVAISYPTSSSLYYYTTSSGILSNNVSSAVIDNSGELWLGSDLGLSRLTDGTWVNYR